MLPNTGTITCLNTDNKSNHFYPNDGEIDQFLRKLSFQPMEESTLQYEFAQATSIPTVSFFSRDSLMSQRSVNVTCSSDSFERLGDITSSDLLDEISSNANRLNSGFSQMEQQARGVKLGILRQLSQSIASGGSSPNIFGLGRQVDSGNGVDIAASSPLILQDLYKAALSCRGTDDFVGGYGGRYWVSNESAIRQVLYLMDQAGHSIDFYYDEELKANLPLVFGVPWLITNSIINYGTKPLKTNIFVVQLRGPTSVKILFSKDKNNSCDRWGIQLYSLPLQNTKINFYLAALGFYTFHVPESEVIVRLKDVELNNIV